MFFFLAQILSFITSPLIWIIGVFIFAIITKNKTKKIKAFIIGSIMLIFFTNMFIVDEFMRAWEVPLTKDEALKPNYDVGIVLGGGMVTNDPRNNRLSFRISPDRIFQAINLYKTHRISKIMLSSGEGSIIVKNNEALLLKEYLTGIGIPEKDLIIESESHNTHQNAQNSCKLINKYSYKNILLITSAYHMRRAMACFHKEGLYPTPYCVDKYAGPRKFYIDHLLLPNSKALILWIFLLHEMIGYTTYFFAGYL
ncbi:MAG: YdcF family protein [Bacteroidota bacterium]|nr:YdcF family protein [Bacteroidota bacterium]